MALCRRCCRSENGRRKAVVVCSSDNLVSLDQMRRGHVGTTGEWGALRLKVSDLFPTTTTAVDLQAQVEVGEREGGGTGKSRGWQQPQHYGYM